MRSHLLPILLLLTGSACSGLREGKCGEGNPASRPIAVLLQHDPWEGGTSLPLFILYEDGRVIYPDVRREGRPVSYRSACVEGSPAELHARFELGPDFRALAARYNYSSWSDAESVFLFAWEGDSIKAVTVRAGRTGPDRFRPDVPAAFRDTYRRMTEFHAAGTTRWKPDSLEVAVWPYEHSPKRPQPWPARWPSIESEGVQHIPDEFVGEVHLISLPGHEQGKLDEFLSGLSNGQAVAMGNRKWTVSYRMRFPGEARWKPFIQDLEM
jgi:hypothetical protein